jgi:hypothetical protein
MWTESYTHEVAHHLRALSNEAAFTAAVFLLLKTLDEFNKIFGYHAAKVQKKCYLCNEIAFFSEEVNLYIFPALRGSIDSRRLFRTEIRAGRPVYAAPCGNKKHGPPP